MAPRAIYEAECSGPAVGPYEEGAVVAAQHTQICIVGGGPGGLTLGLELARRGNDVVLIEQSGHYSRSFRGETVSPDCVYLLNQLGVLEKVRYHGVIETRGMDIVDGGSPVLQVDFSSFDYHYRYPMEMPQCNLLDVLLEEAEQYPNLTVLRRATATELVADSDRFNGVRCTTPEGETTVRAALTVGADGRYSKVRDMAGVPHRKIPQQRDVVWLKVPRPEEWDAATYRIRLRGERNGVFFPTYPDLVRVGFNIPKGGLRELRRQGIGALHERLDELAPELSDLVRFHIRSWSETSMLDIFTTVVPRWSRPGLLLIGDAAHTFSPILGQGVNHAIIDAVTLAPRLTTALQERGTTAELDLLARDFQRSRENHVRASRSLQLRQERVFTFARTPAVLLRKNFYRSMHRSSTLRNFLLNKAYFQIQPRHERDFQPASAIS